MKIFPKLVPVVAFLLSTSLVAQADAPIPPQQYVGLLGKGLDVDWSKTGKGRRGYNAQAVRDFKALGLSHVRIRIKDAADASLFATLDRQIDDFLSAGLIPVVAYQGADFKAEPTPENASRVAGWWRTVARRYAQKSHRLSFDLLIEVTEALNKQPQALNALYEETISAIRQSNPTRIVFISPRLRSAPEYLSELKIPGAGNGYLMAEWHFYAAGPQKDNPLKQWTSGPPAERKLITDKIAAALAWQKKTGILTWVGAWMPGNYNKGGDYSVAEQIAFARFVASELDRARVPYAVNSDSKFYDYARGAWIPAALPVLQAVLQPATPLVKPSR